MPTLPGPTCGILCRQRFGFALPIHWHIVLRCAIPHALASSLQARCIKYNTDPVLHEISACWHCSVKCAQVADTEDLSSRGQLARAGDAGTSFVGGLMGHWIQQSGLAPGGWGSRSLLGPWKVSPARGAPLHLQTTADVSIVLPQAAGIHCSLQMQRAQAHTRKHQWALQSL